MIIFPGLDPDDWEPPLHYGIACLNIDLWSNYFFFSCIRIVALCVSAESAREEASV